MNKDVEDKIIDLYQKSRMSPNEVIESLARLLATAQAAKASVESEKR